MEEETIPDKLVTPLNIFCILKNGPLSRLDILSKFNADRTIHITRSLLDSVIRSGIIFNYLSEQNTIVRINLQMCNELDRASVAGPEPNMEAHNSVAKPAENKHQNIKENKATGKKRKAEKKKKVPSIPKEAMAANEKPNNISIAKIRALAAKKLKLNGGPKLPDEIMETLNFSGNKKYSLTEVHRNLTKIISMGLLQMGDDGLVYALRANGNPILGKKRGIVRTNLAEPQGPDDTAQWIVPSLPKIKHKARKIKPQGPDDTAQWIVPSLPKIKHKARKIKPKRANMPQKPHPKQAALPKCKRKGKNVWKKKYSYNLNRQYMEAKKMARDNQMAIQFMLVPKKTAAKNKAKALYSIKICKKRMPKKKPAKQNAKIFRVFSESDISYFTDDEDDESYCASYGQM